MISKTGFLSVKYWNVGNGEMSYEVFPEECLSEIKKFFKHNPKFAIHSFYSLAPSEKDPNSLLSATQHAFSLYPQEGTK